MIEYAIRRLKEDLASKQQHPLGWLFSRETILVPMPKSAPLKDKAALWIPRRLCGAMRAQGLGSHIEELVERVEAVPKSAYAAPGDRPTPTRHYDTMRARRTMIPDVPIIVVDDVITRGATALGAVSRLRDLHIARNVYVFALFRAISQGEVEQMLAPVSGTVTLRRWGPQREP